MKKILLTILACAAVFTSCKKEAATVYVSEIKLEQQSKDVVEGGTYQIKATALPENAANKKLSYTPDNSGVCTVDETGLVTAVKVGQAKVIVAATDGSKTFSDFIINVVAKSIPITKIEISNTALNMKAGEEFTLTYKAYPENTTTHDVMFGFKDNGVIKVDALSGKVTALKAGTSEVVALSMTDGVQSDICVVTVTEPKSMFLKFKQALMRVGNKAMTQAVWYGNAEEYSDREDVENPTWTTFDAGVVSLEGSKFTAVAPGETTIKAADADGNEIECAVKVLAPTDKNWDYNYGVQVIDCGELTAAWKTKDTFVLGPGYVDGTQRITNESVNGYKLAEVNFYDKPCDASAIKNPALYLRLFISDVNLIALDGAGEIELRSNMESSYSENEELTWPWSYFCADAASAHPTNAKLHLKNGWNNIVLPFALSHQGQTTTDLGGFRANKISYLRIFQNPDAAKKGMKFIIDQARIVDWTEFNTCDNFDMWFDRMTDANCFLCNKDTEDKKEGAASFSVADHIIAGPASNLRLEMWPGLEYAMPADMDLTNSAIKFWLYVSDGEAFKGMHCVFELSSELINDAHNFNWAKGPGEIDFKTGWNELTFDFAACGGDVRAESKRDIRKINYFRAVFTPQGAPAKPYTYKIDDIRIVKK